MSGIEAVMMYHITDRNQDTTDLVSGVIAMAEIRTAMESKEWQELEKWQKTWAPESEQSLELEQQQSSSAAAGIETWVESGHKSLGKRSKGDILQTAMRNDSQINERRRKRSAPQCNTCESQQLGGQDVYMYINTPLVCVLCCLPVAALMKWATSAVQVDITAAGKLLPCHPAISVSGGRPSWPIKYCSERCQLHTCNRAIYTSHKQCVLSHARAVVAVASAQSTINPWTGLVATQAAIHWKEPAIIRK